MTDDVPDHLVRAFTYPYPAPEHAFLWRDGDVVAFDPKGLTHEAATFAGRTPVLAIGSNRAPEQLTRKFATHASRHGGAEAVIPVLRAWVGDVDVVFSTHFSGYGALPAILAHSPGTEVQIALNWLTDGQLEIMHGTESLGQEYTFESLSPMRIRLEGDVSPPAVYGYVGMHPCFAPEGAPVAFSAIPARGRVYRALDKPTALEKARRIVGFEGDVHAFVGQIIADRGFRAEAMAKLREKAVILPKPTEALRRR